MGNISNKYGVKQLVGRLKKHQLKHVVISPGSRNAPLSISLSSDEDYTCYSIPDERSAAFYALGMAERLQQPTAIICTSGSALLNYYPAVCEAFYRGIPLIVISADRPLEWTDQGDGQTIRQVDALNNHILGQISLIEEPKNENERWFNSREIDRLLNIASKKGGPIHINFPFDEPLYNTIKKGDIQELNHLTELLTGKMTLSSTELNQLVEEWNSASKKMIICGQLPKNKRLQQQLINLTEDSSVAILVENTSNLVYKGFIHCIDRTLNSIDDDNKTAFAPDLLITIGGAVVSKKIKAYLRSYKPKFHWKIGVDFPFMDTYQSLTKSIPLSPADFFTELTNTNIQLNSSRFGEQWKQLDYLIQDQHHNYFQKSDYADLSVFQILMDVIPEQSVLHLANSSVVRYSQLFDPIASIDYYSNRGTSGIDGSTSTALGAALVDKNNLHSFITGDISFFYDSNAFWNNHIPPNFRIFVINNGGGGIFKIIPGPDTSSALDDHFVAKQDFSAKYICKAFNINYVAAESIDELNDKLPEFYNHQENSRPALMEIFTPHELNDKVLKDYFNAIKITPKLLK